MDRDDTIMGKLFATTVTNAKPTDRDYKLADGAGLYLLVKTNGAKLWRLNYRHWASSGHFRSARGRMSALRLPVRNVTMPAG
nr:Arm DNA-binding domain-containing protein [Sphingomonas sp.]